MARHTDTKTYRRVAAKVEIVARKSKFCGSGTVHALCCSAAKLAKYLHATRRTREALGTLQDALDYGAKGGFLP